jgi:hypothetical protein
MTNWLKVVPVFGIASAVAAACGGSSDTTGAGQDASSGDASVEGGSSRTPSTEASTAEDATAEDATAIDSSEESSPATDTGTPETGTACGALTTCTPDGGAPYCANTQSDNANCGTCGASCTSGTVCGGGHCSLTCGALTTCTPDGGAPYCANTQSDDANCGTCGTACPTGQSCSSGSCRPAPGSTAGCADAEDPYWTSVIAYIPCTGASIIDASGKSTITRYNSPTIAATPAGAPGGASCNLNNAGSYATANGFGVTIPAAVGTGDFTVEISVYQTAWNDPSDQNANILLTSTAYPPAAGNFPTFFSHNSVAHVQFVPGSGGTNFTDTGSTLNTWENYAASRVSGTTYVFRGGVLLTSSADTSNYTDTVFFVGHQANGSYNAMMGAVGQIRVTTAGRYTSPYTPCNGFATH